MGKVAGAALLSAVLVGGVVAHTGVLLVDVQGETGPRVWVPVPVVLARGGLLVGPEKARRIEAPGLERYLAHAGRVVDALRESPDGLLLVEVRDGDQHVTVRKEGDALRVRSLEGGRHGDRRDVEALVPLRSVEAVVRAYDAEEGHFRTGKLVGALSAAPRGDLVRVHDGESRVRIRRLF